MEVRRRDPKVKARVLDVMRFFAYRSGGHTSQRRTAKLAYLSELLFLEGHHEPLTGAKFISYDYGPWSFEIATAYDAIEAECEDMKVVSKETPHGNALLLQPTRSETVIKLGKERNEVLSKVFDMFGYIKTDLIVQFTKRASLYKKTSYADTIDFSEYERKRRVAIDKLRKSSVGKKIEVPSLGYQLKVQVEEVGYSAECEDLPGCITQGDTFEELEENVRQAILGYIECEDELNEATA
jgi:predicted RNase H-like HicB family nuclease